MRIAGLPDAVGVGEAMARDRLLDLLAVEVNAGSTEDSKEMQALILREPAVGCVANPAAA